MSYSGIAGIACSYNTGLVIEGLRVRIPAGAAGEFSSPELTLCADLFGVRPTPGLPQWHVKDPGQTDLSAVGRLHLNMHTPQQVKVG